MSFSVNEFVIGSTIHGEFPVKKAPKVASSLVAMAHFKPKKAENGPNGPS